MIEHNITVKHLKELLKKVKDTDLLVLNHVGNLLIVRNKCMIGYIDLQENFQSIDFFKYDAIAKEYTFE